MGREHSGLMTTSEEPGPQSYSCWEWRLATWAWVIVGVSSLPGETGRNSPAAVLISVRP